MRFISPHRLSKKELAVVLVGFALIGTVITAFSRAGTSYSLQAKIEAEAMTPAKNSRIYNDTTASAGKYVSILSNGFIKSPSFKTTDKVVKLEITAKGAACKGSPYMIVKIDDRKVGSTITVGAKSWYKYVVATSVSAGTHTVSIEFPNDYYAPPTCDRNLLVDQVSAFAVTPLPGDTTAPTVTIDSPKDGATLSGTVAISSSASDNVAVTKTEFYTDGILASSDTASPYTSALDTTKLTNGTHSLEVKAYDSAGNVGSKKINITTSNAAAPTSPTSSLGLNIGYFPNATAFTKIVGSPVIRSDSADFMKQFTAGSFWNPNFSIGSYGVAIVKGTGEFTSFPAPPPAEGYQYIGSAGKFPVPKVPPGTKPVSGTDGHLAVIVGRTVYEIFKATVSADGTITNAKAVARANLDGNGQTNQTDAPSNAAGLSLLAGLITPEELASGHIDHALVFSVPGIKAGSAIFPAWSNVYVSGPNTVLAEGSKIQLDPSFNVASLPEPQKTIARALQTHGAYLRDNGGTFAIYGETSTRWPSGYGTGMSLRSIPWDKIRVISYQP